MKHPMPLARPIPPGKARFSALAGIFAVSLLGGCAYDDGYYDPSPGYGYDYGYGGYGYGYGGYGYGYGHYGDPCRPYGCDDWHHGRHHHQGWDGDGDGDNNHHHHHHGGDGAQGGQPPGEPGHVDNPPPPVQPRPARPRVVQPSSPSPYPVWTPRG